VAPHSTDKTVRSCCYRFDFRSGPGALIAFVSASTNWTIQQFSITGTRARRRRIVVGVQVGDGERDGLQAFLSGTGHRHSEEPANPGYALFLGPPTADSRGGLSRENSLRYVAQSFCGEPGVERARPREQFRPVPKQATAAIRGWGAPSSGVKPAGRSILPWPAPVEAILDLPKGKADGHHARAG